MATNTFSGTGNWSDNARWSLGRPPTIANADKVVIAAAAVCTLDGVYSAGDDTTTALTLNGTLKWSRSATSGLTVRGQIVYGSGGEIDIGTEASPIPAAYTATLVYNDSAAMAHGKYGLTTVAGAVGFRAWGADKTRFSEVVATTSTTVFDVADVTGWVVGDVLFLGPTSSAAATVEVRSITAITPGAGTTGTVTIGAAPVNTTVTGRVLINVTRNVRVYPSAAQTYASTLTLGLNNAALSDNFLELGPCEFLGIGSAASLAAGAGVVLTANKPSQIKKVYGPVFHDVASVSGSTVTTCPAPVAVGNLTPLTINPSATCTNEFGNVTVATKSTTRGPSIGSAASFSASGMLVMGVTMATPNAIGAGTAYSPKISGARFYGVTDLTGGGFLGLTVSDSYFDALARMGFTISAVTASLMRYKNCAFGSVLGVVNLTDFFRGGSTLQSWVFDGCTFPTGLAVSRSLSSLSSMLPDSYLLFVNMNNDPGQQLRYTYGGEQKRDNAVTKRGTSSVRFDCWYAANPLTYSFVIKVAANQTINVRGATRYNAAYGTTTPPTVTISGLGITPVVFTDPATGADTWHDYSINATNPNAYPGEFTVTYTGQSAANSTGAYCYFDGVPDSPWIDSVRHYGYLFDSNAYRTANTAWTTAEATVAAYTGIAVNHTTQVITVSGNHTTKEVWEWLLWDLVQQQGEPHHITETGADFTTTYSLVVSNATLTGSFTSTGTVSFVGTGAVVGRYVDSSGAHVAIAAPAIVSGSRVQLYNVTDSTELYNGVLGSDGIVLAATWTADKTIRLRADHAGKVALEVLGILSSIGLTFLDTQADDVAYTSAGIDGSTVTEFAADNVDIQAEVTDSDNVTTWQRLYAWWQWYQTTEAGIASPLFGRLRSDDGANFYLDRSGGVGVTIRNNKTDPLRFTGGYLQTSDGSIPFDLTGGNIFPDYGKVYLPPSYATDVWSAPTRTLTNGQLLLDAADRLVVMNDGKLLAKS